MITRTYVDQPVRFQKLFDESNYDMTYVRDAWEDFHNEIIFLTIVYPTSYDLSREIFKVIPDLKKYEYLHKTTNLHKNKNIEILKLSF